MSEERRRRQRERTNRDSLSEMERRTLSVIRWARARLPHPLWGLVAATLLPITGHSYLVLRSIGLLIVAIWLAVEFLAWWIPLKWKPQYRWSIGVAVVEVMFIGMMWSMWWWMGSELEDQRVEVRNKLAFDYHVPKTPNVTPMETTFTVKNNSQYGISKRNKLLCYINLGVGNNGTSFNEYVWEAQAIEPTTGKWMGALSGASDTNNFWESMVDAGELGPGGDAETDNCLSVLGFKLNTQCIDVNVVFLYTLDNQPEIRQEREFRYVGTVEGDSFYWQPQPINSPTKYCKSYYKGDTPL